MRCYNLQDLCFACPDGTIGVVAGFSKAEFDCRSERDRDYIYKQSGKLGLSVKVLLPMLLEVSY